MFERGIPCWNVRWEAAAKEEQRQKHADQREHNCHCYDFSFKCGLLRRRQQLKRSNGKSMQISVSMIVTVATSHSSVDCHVGGSS